MDQWGRGVLGDDDLKVVRSQLLFANLPDDAFNRLTENTVPRRYPKGKILFQRGDPADYFYIVLDGWVKLYRDTPDGTQVVVNIFCRGNMFAEAAAFMSTGYPVSAEVIDDSRLLAIQSKRFNSIVQSNPEVALNMLAAMSRHLHELVHEVEYLKSHTASERLAMFLLRCCPVARGAARVKLPYDKNLIAARIGIKPESLSRLLNRLRAHGVETDHDAVTIADVARLRSMCPRQTPWRHAAERT